MNEELSSMYSARKPFPFNITQSAKWALKGKERLRVVFWLWGVGLYILSIITGFVVMFMPVICWSIIGVLTGILGFILVFVYPFMFCFSLWRCADNTLSRWCAYGAKIYAFAFIPCVHIWTSPFILMASVGLAFYRS